MVIQVHVDVIARLDGNTVHVVIARLDGNTVHGVIARLDGNTSPR